MLDWRNLVVSPAKLRFAIIEGWTDGILAAQAVNEAAADLDWPVQKWIVYRVRLCHLPYLSRFIRSVSRWGPNPNEINADAQKIYERQPRRGRAPVLR